MTHPVVAAIEAARREAALERAGLLGNLLISLLKPPPVIRYHRTDEGRWVAADDGGWIPGSWRWKWQARRAVRKYLDHLLVEQLWGNL